MGTGDVRKALLKLAQSLESHRVPYATAGAMASNELVKHAKLPRALGDQLDESVRAKFHELLDAAQLVDPED